MRTIRWLANCEEMLEASRFETELEGLTDSETGEERDELEYEIRWTR